jgi:outer membrane receptor for ferrienterochelin and colicins
MARSTPWRFVAALLLVSVSSVAQAQRGRIVGTVSDSSKAPVAGAQVIVSPGLSAVSSADGRVILSGVPAGQHELRVFRVGFKSATASVLVTAGQDATVAIIMTPASATLAGVVVSASRRLEKVTEAPATVTRLDDMQIAGAIGNSFAPALKEVKGLEFIQTGVMSSAVNARGFNSAFNNRMLMMEDGRIATLAESGLPIGALTTIPKLDLAGIEVLVGPGSALYGPDASAGVLTLQTKDPRQFPGTSVEVAGGARSYMDIQGRHAGVAGNWGYKIMGEYQSAQDYENSLTYPSVTTPTGASGPIPEVGADFKAEVIRGSGTLAYYLADGSRISGTAGASRLNGIGMTNVGRNQLVDYGYRNYQLQFVSPRWFAQAYMTNSLPGGTYQLNGFAQNSRRFPTISEDSVKKLSAFPGEGRVYAAEIQNNFSIGMVARTGSPFIDNTLITYGAQIRRDQVSSNRKWLSDRSTGEDIVNEQTGAYAQLEMPVTSMVKLVAAGRYDKHDKYDAQFSPKAALLVTPWKDQTFRASFNRAFKSPSILQTDFFFPNFQPNIGVFGNFDGFVIRSGSTSAAAVVREIAAIRPELNDTWEVGYKGILNDRLYVDVTGYRTKFTDFQSPLVVIANPFAGAAATYAFNARTGALITSETGGNQVALTYFNVGQAWMRGIDAGFKYIVTPRIAASLNTSLISLDSIKRNATDPVEATSFNSPSVRVTAGMDFTDVATSKLNVGWTARYVNKYDFRSGIHVGTIPAFGTFDISGNYQVLHNASFILQATNVYACIGGTTTPPATGVSSASAATYTKGKKCGFGQEHQEILNMPALGSTVLVGLRWDIR